jgi:deoxyribodipyrimidine photolyase-related protein
MPTSHRHLRLILGDQLNHQHFWYSGQSDPQTLYVLMECRSETDYVQHHIQKVIGFFLGMRHFAGFLREKGHEVLYLELDDERNRSSIAANIQAIISEYGIETFEYQQPDEYRLDEELAQLCEQLSIPTRCVDTGHFMSDRQAVEELFAGKKMYLLETFYRDMRRRYGILMEADGETPLTGQWNYDRENRKKLPDDQPLPKHRVLQPLL